MLEDRDYMRQLPSVGGSAHSRWSPSVVLMVVLTAAFAIQCINDVYIQSPVEEWLALTPFALSKGYVWQLLTFQFLHLSLWHLVGNLIMLWFFGRLVEDVLGTRRFLIAYFGGGVIGGLLQCALMLLFPQHFPPFTYGASAGIAGIFAIFCRLQSDSEIRWNFILPIRADVLLWITAAISLFFTIVPSARGGFIAHAAHLGGILTGVLWVKLGWHHHYIQLPWENWFRHDKSSQARQMVESNKRENKFDNSSADEFLQNEVDPILEKISAKGIQSLTDRERTTLEKARDKMAKR
jgi:membrane associated rhomboid family serine protease